MFCVCELAKTGTKFGGIIYNLHPFPRVCCPVGYSSEYMVFGHFRGCLGAIGIVKIVYEKIKLHCSDSLTGIFVCSLLLSNRMGTDLAVQTYGHKIYKAIVSLNKHMRQIQRI